jgi:hypothetical protein
MGAERSEIQFKASLSQHNCNRMDVHEFKQVYQYFKSYNLFAIWERTNYPDKNSRYEISIFPLDCSEPRISSCSFNI